MNRKRHPAIFSTSIMGALILAVKARPSGCASRSLDHSGERIRYASLIRFRGRKSLLHWRRAV